MIRRAGRSAILTFLATHKSVNVVRPSGKVVVFDVKISVQLAFYALVEHDMQCAPLWDSDTRQVNKSKLRDSHLQFPHVF